jgi:hypothetical protein
MTVEENIRKNIKKVVKNMKIIHLALSTFSTVVDSGGRFWAITRINISLELIDVKKQSRFQFNAGLKITSDVILRKITHVRIPPGLFSIATTAQLTFRSSIFFDAVNTVSVGATVATLRN